MALEDKVISGAGQVAGAAGQGVSRAAAEETRRRERRLAMHLAAVQVLREKPKRAEKVRDALDRWEADTLAEDPGLVAQWRQILKCQEWGSLLEESEAGERLRKGSPFGFVIDEAERFGILRKFSSRAG